MGQLVEIEISDFASFHGLVEIKLADVDFCQWFTVISENKLRQSNFYDAIAFVLGELDDEFINFKNLSWNTFVSIKLQCDDNKINTFKCSVDNKEIEYSINNKILSKKKYIDLLKNYLKTEPKNIIINKESINSRLIESPNARTLYFEEICNSIIFKNSYDRLKSELDLIYKQINNVAEKKNKLLDLSKSLSALIGSEDNLNDLYKLTNDKLETFSLFESLIYDTVFKKAKDDFKNSWSVLIDNCVSKISELIEKLSTLKITDNESFEIFAQMPNPKKCTKPPYFLNQLKNFKIIKYNENQPENNYHNNDTVTMFKRFEEYKKLFIAWEQYCHEFYRDFIDNMKNNKQMKCIIEEQYDLYKKSRPRLHEKVDEFIKMLCDLKISLKVIVTNSDYKIPKVPSKNCTSFDIERNKFLIELMESFFQISYLSNDCSTYFDELSTLKNNLEKRILPIIQDSNPRNIKSILNPVIKSNRSLLRNYSKLPKNLLDIDIINNIEKANEISDKLKTEIFTLNDIIINLVRTKQQLKENKQTVIKYDAINNNLIKSKKLIQKKLNNVKKQRSDLFLNFFIKVNKNLNDIYKILSGQDNAEAKLIPVNSKEPYLDEIKFECMGQSMESLDNKEQNLAVLALLLSIRLVNPTSFILLENIDDELDDNQSSRLANYLGQLKNNQQIVLIRKFINDNIFKNSDIIINVEQVLEKDRWTSNLSILKA